MQASAEFILKPTAKGIENAKNKSNQFFKSHGISENAVHKQIMILDELVNCCSIFGEIELPNNQIRVQINIDEITIRIEVSKPIDGVALTQVEKMDKTIQFIRGFQDPYEAFLKMKAAPVSQYWNGEYGLCLAKIASEGNALVDFFINEDNILFLSAVRSLGGS